MDPPARWPIWCGWLVRRDPPQQACTQPAGWSMSVARRAIVVCDVHHADGLRWVLAAAAPGEQAHVVDLWPDPHGTLF